MENEQRKRRRISRRARNYAMLDWKMKGSRYGSNVIFIGYRLNMVKYARPTSLSGERGTTHVRLENEGLKVGL